MDVDSYELRLLRRTRLNGGIMIGIGVVGLLSMLASVVLLLVEPVLLRAVITMLAGLGLSLIHI